MYLNVLEFFLPENCGHPGVNCRQKCTENLEQLRIGNGGKFARSFRKMAELLVKEFILGNGRCGMTLV